MVIKPDRKSRHVLNDLITGCQEVIRGNAKDDKRAQVTKKEHSKQQYVAATQPHKVAKPRVFAQWIDSEKKATTEQNT
jgi:hypothetical protein